MAREYSSKRARKGSSVPQQMMVMVMTFVLGYFTASIFDINALSHWLSSQVSDSQKSKAHPIKEQAQREPITAAKPKFEFYTLLANEKGVGGQQAANHNAPTSLQTPEAQQAALANAAAHVVSTSSMRQVNSSATPATVVTATPATAVRTAVNKPVQSVRAQPQAIATIAKQSVTAKTIAPTRPARGNFVVQVASFKARQDAEHMKGLLILKGFEVNVVPVATANQGSWFRVIIGPYPNRVLALKAQGILAKTQRLKGMVRSA